ncbi:MAG: ABC transporter permease [Clostridiales bacterium]|jgi:spermidine/putrescine transport system permease protein|nr:ABC transporter permease [Clostridiales bacterium]
MKKLFAYPYVVWISIFIVVPLLLVLYYSLTAVDADGAAYFTLDNYRRFFEASTPGQPFLERIYVSVMLRSIWLALISTAICFVLGYPAAYIMAGKGFSDKSFLLFLFLVPMWMNFLLRTYAWLTILEQNGVLNNLLGFLGIPKLDILYTDAAVVLGMVYNFLPFMILPIYTSLRKTDRSLIEAAQDLGADGIKVFSRVVFPLSIPGVVSGVTMVFMPGVTTFIISNLLGGGQYILIGNLIEQQFLKVGDWRFGSAISVILIILILISMGIFARVDKEPVTTA